MNQSTDFHILAAYVNAVADLAESVKKDLVDNGGEISTRTINCLNKLSRAAQAAEKMLDILDETGYYN